MIDKIAALPLKTAPIAEAKPTEGISAAEMSNRFGQFLNDSIQKLNDDQSNVDKLNTQFVKGELSDVHQLMIASEKASLGLQLTVQVRNKVIEAYQEIMRTQI